MDEECEYFDSSRWDDRIEAHACQAWDFETFLRNAESWSFDQELIERIATTSSKYTASDLAVADVGTVIDIATADGVDISRADVREAWVEANMDTIPDTCPHSVADEHEEFCIFHMSPEERHEAEISADVVADSIEERIRDAGEQAKQFVGAWFQHLDLSSRKLISDDNDTIDFRYITVEEGGSFAETIFGHDVSFKGAVFKREDTNNDETDPSFGDHYVEFEGEIDCMRAVFEGNADFKFVEFAGNVRFNNATFEGAAMFNYGHFGAKSDFMGATFRGKADFSKAYFEDATYLNGEYDNAGIFNYTHFGGQVDFWSTKFEEKAEFWAATFDGPLDCSHTEFHGDARFTEAVFEDIATFNNAIFERTAVFKRVNSGTGWVDLEKTTISAGLFTQPRDGSAFFDVTRATLGDVDLGSGSTTDQDVFEYLRIWQTKFEGFDFAEYTHALKPDWTIHTNNLSGSPFNSPDNPSLEQLDTLEQTYLRAKNGANAVGHNLAASHFFRKEMKYRRYQHWGRIFQGGIRSRAKAFWRWSSNGLLGLTTGYGEEPRRTIVASVTTIFVFAFFYWALPSTPDYIGRFGQGYLLVSFQSFITFILGRAPVGATPGLQFVSAVEGFIGAFLIALLVFTLTRSIHR